MPQFDILIWNTLLPIFREFKNKISFDPIFSLFLNENKTIILGREISQPNRFNNFLYLKIKKIKNKLKNKKEKINWKY